MILDTITNNPEIVSTISGLIGAYIGYKFNVKKQKIDNPEYIKTMYGLFITNLDEYKDYFIKYEFGKYIFIKNNELLQDEYANLVRSYVNKFLEIYGKSEVVQTIIKVKYNDEESFVKFMIRDFDVFLFNKSIISKDQLDVISKSKKEAGEYYV